MDCPEFLARYSDYDDSLLPAAEAERFRAHMAECNACARYDRVLRKGRMLARQVHLVPTRDFGLQLRRRLWRESHGSGRRLQRPARVAAALAALTVLLSASAVLGVLPTGPSPDTAATLSPVAAERAVRTAAARALPVVDAPRPRAWSERVARRPVGTYSPLVVGPPAYGRAVRVSN